MTTTTSYQRGLLYHLDTRGVFLLEFLERAYGSLEKHELIEALTNHLLTLYPQLVQDHANVIVHYAVIALHGDGPQAARVNAYQEVAQLDAAACGIVAGLLVQLHPVSA